MVPKVHGAQGISHVYFNTYTDRVSMTLQAHLTTKQCDHIARARPLEQKYSRWPYTKDSVSCQQNHRLPHIATQVNKSCAYHSKHQLDGRASAAILSDGRRIKLVDFA
jgi:hypothetical protein